MRPVGAAKENGYKSFETCTCAEELIKNHGGHPICPLSKQPCPNFTDSKALDEHLMLHASSWLCKTYPDGGKHLAPMEAIEAWEAYKKGLLGGK